MSGDRIRHCSKDAHGIVHHWIPVSQAKPEDESTVLLAHVNGDYVDVDLGYWNEHSNRFCFHDPCLEMHLPDATHWMTIPEPPVLQNKEKN